MRAIAAFVLLGACAHAAPTPLPSLNLPLLAGGTWSSTSARGSVLVIDVWASWCKPCAKAFPKLDAFAASHPDVKVVAISIDEDLAAASDFAASLRVPAAHDANQSVTRAPLGITRLPTLLVVDRDGIVRRRIDEPTERDYDRLEELTKL
jgi:thiol-disulfide isomerase/thioredoxin